MKPLLAAACLTWATGAVAQEDHQTLGAADFRAFSEKWTLYFSRQGAHYGAEQFYGRSRTTWQLANGECLDGIWYADGPYICFEYDDPDSPHCWTMVRRGDTIEAQPAGSDDPSRKIRVYLRDKTPLDCAGPEIGA